MWLLLLRIKTAVDRDDEGRFYNRVYEATNDSVLVSSNHTPSIDWTFVILGLRNYSEFAFIAVFFFTGTILFFRKSDNWIAVYLAFTFVSLGIGQVTNNRHFLFDPTPENFLYRITDVFSVFSAVFLFYVMPYGRFVVPWARYTALLWGLITLAWTFFPSLPFNPLDNVSFDRTKTLSMVVFLLPVLTGVYAQIISWRTTNNMAERQQVRWIITGMLFTVIAGVIVYTGPRHPQSRSEEFENLARNFISLIIASGFPVCLTIAVTRYHLWELNNFISQILVWSLMTTIVIAIFILIVGVAGNIINSPSNPVLSAAATALVAVIFQPVRYRVQTFINRFLFGLRDDPMTVISQIGEHNQSGNAPDHLMSEIVATIAHLLKLPYVNVELMDGDIPHSAAVYGHEVKDTVLFPLIYQNKAVGSLIVGTRTPEQPFTNADMRLLETISWQVAALAHILLLNADLQRSREHLVQVADRERQRLQRDLHDGLGTELSAQMLKIGTAKAHIHQNPDRADELLTDVEHKLIGAVGEVRRLIHNLRPPVLDQLGLIKSIELFIEDYRQRDFEITLFTPAQMPRLSPVIEIATYRIIQEAVTNVVKHAQATHCTVQLELNDSLKICVSDNGIGIPTSYTQGVGMGSIQERAEELGGSVHILQPDNGTGTVIQATLPIQNYLFREVLSDG